MLNKIILQGRLTRDPELRRTQSGTAVAAASIAVERDYKDQNGNREADFIDLVAWRGTAELICKYFRKGSAAVVEGRLQIRAWKDKEGNTRRTAEVVVDNIYFGASKKEETGTPSAETQARNRENLQNRMQEYPMEGPSDDFVEIGDEDGELPF